MSPTACVRLCSAIFLAATCMSAHAPAQRPEADSRTRPNILFLFSDDHAPHAIGAYGSRINATPNIDQLAAEGALFRSSFCGNSICAPSRATVLTGLHSHANGVMRNGHRLRPEVVTFPGLLRSKGYRTAVIGKWHLRSDPAGFDHWEVLPGQGHYYNPDFRSAAGTRRIEGHSTEVIADLALEWLRSVREEEAPFLLMCQFKAPHRPWMPGPRQLSLFRGERVPEPATLFDDASGRGPAASHHEMGIDAHLTMAYDLFCPVSEEEPLFGAYRGLMERMTPAQRETWDAAFAAENEEFQSSDLDDRALVQWKYQRYIQNYLRCVAGVDAAVGRLLAYLDEAGLSENTLVVYSSDQGFYLGDHGWYDKRWMYEESFRMPLLVRWPGRVAAGSEIDHLVQNIDYAPTFLEAAGLEPPPATHGRSLLPLLAGEPPADWRKSLYYHYYESRATHRVAAHDGVRTARYKLIHFYEPEYDYWELYDLREDPEELRSVYGQPAYAEKAEELRRELVRLRTFYAVPSD